MKSENADHLDRALHRTLQEWKITDSLPPRFADRVWRRIEKGSRLKSPRAWVLVKAWLEGLTRPALASTYIAFLLLLGIGAGYWHARMDNERSSQELGARYVQMMDPYQRR